MSSTLTPFAFEDNLVRVHLDAEGKPWFVAKDVCHVLEIEWKGSGTLGPLDDNDEKITVSNPDGNPREGIPQLG